MTPKEARAIHTLARLDLPADRIAERLGLPEDDVRDALKQTHPWRMQEDAMFRPRGCEKTQE